MKMGRQTWLLPERRLFGQSRGRRAAKKVWAAISFLCLAYLFCKTAALLALPGRALDLDRWKRAGVLVREERLVSATPASIRQIAHLIYQSRHCGLNLTIPRSATADVKLSFTKIACHRRGYPHDDETVVVTSMDSKFTTRLAAFLASVQAHNRGDVRVAVLTTVGDAAQLHMQCTMAAKLPSIRLEFYAMPADVLQGIFRYQRQDGVKNVLQHVPVSTMLRLLAPAILPYERIVYLDLDVLVRTDLARLRTGRTCTVQDPGGRFLQSSGICAKSTIQDNLKGWMLPEWRCTFQIYGPQHFRQFNAGVMVMDLGIMRQRHAVQYAVALSDMFSLNDQSILNLFANGKFDELAPNLNLYYGQDSNKFSTDDAILHPAGSRKPWLSSAHEWSEAWLQHEPVGHLFVWTSAVDQLTRRDIMAVDAAVAHSGGRPVTAFCGNKMCMGALTGLPYVQVHRFRIRDFEKSPLAPWFWDHAILKVLHGIHYEKHLQAAARLAILYAYGGILYDGKVLAKHSLPDAAWNARRPWCHSTTAEPDELADAIFFRRTADLALLPSLRLPGSSPSGLATITAFAPRRDPRVLNAIHEFLGARPTYHRGKAWPIDWAHDWLTAPCSSAAARLSAAPFPAARYFIPIPGAEHDVDAKASLTPRPSFGAIWYDERSRYLDRIGNHAVNLGDEIQSLASLQWLPFMEHKVERDLLVAPQDTSGSNVTVITNAWYGTPNMTWPPQGKGLDPIPVAMHIEPKLYGLFSKPASLEYLASIEPIGARDMATLDFLRAHNVSAFFSACMTLTVHIHKTGASSQDDKSCGVVFVDVQKEALKNVIPRAVLECGTEVSAKWRDVDGSHDTLDGVLRFQSAFNLLKTYSRARVIVTSRLHTALPAASMGIPVVLVLSDSMPGGGGASDGMQRFAGLTETVHWVRISKKGQLVAFSPDMEVFDWDNPVPSLGGVAAIRRLRCQLLRNVSQQRPALREGIETFLPHGDFC